MAPIKLIIDTDPGVDDAMAILAAFNAPEEIEVLGLTTLYGNVPTPMATRNALALCERAGRPDVPVVEGAHKSLRGVAKERIADFVHGADGFGNTHPPPPQGQPLADCSAAEFMVRMARQHPGQVVVLALAALTNVALAIHLEPRLPEMLDRIVVLGGAFNVNGNVNPAAEANVYGDCDAANVVLSRAANVWMLGLDVTHACHMPAAQLEGVRGRGRHGDFLHAISQFYLEYHRRSYGMDAIYLHDPTAVAAVVAPQLLEWEEGAVVVVDDGPAKGRTVMDQGRKNWVGVNEWQARPRIKVALGVRNPQAVTDWILERLTR